MRLFWVLLLLLTAQSGATADQPTVIMTFEPLLEPGTAQFDKIEVSLRFPGDSDGVTEVELPDEWGGYSKLYEHLDNFRADGARTLSRSATGKVIIEHQPDAALTLRYEINGIQRADGATAKEYRPIVTANYFHLLGTTIVARPKHIGDDAKAQFIMKGMPTGTGFASDMEHGRNGRVLTFNDLVESISVGGDFRILEAGNGARLAIRGKLDLRDDAAWLASFRTVAQAVGAYWESDAGPYLVTILPFQTTPAGSTSIGGTGLKDAFAFFATTNAQPDALDMLMTHEMTHSWVPGRIGKVVDKPIEAEQYWFSEGLTDFTTWRALARSGAWTPEQYFQQINKALGEYDGISARTMPNLESAKLFWSSAEMQRLTYVRGALFALWFDDHLRRNASGWTVRRLLLAMQDRAAKLDHDQLEKLGRGVGLLRKAAVKAGVPIEPALAEHIDAGKPVIFPEDFLSRCGRLATVTQAKFERGFDSRATAVGNGLIVGVVEGSLAYRAGLRNGMKILRRTGGEIGNSQVELVYAVDDNGVEKTLRWMPQSNEVEAKRIFTTRLDDAEQRKACLAVLSD